MAATGSMSGHKSASRSDSHTVPPSRLSLKHITANTPIMSIEMPLNDRHSDDSSPPTQDNCDRHDVDPTNISSTTVAPFLAKHIPEQYAPLGQEDKKSQNPNTKYCYRHRPDLKCRRTADEPSMENLQRVSVTYVVVHSDSLRIWKLYHKRINKAYLTYGHYSLLLQQSIETLCFKASLHNVASLNSLTYPLPSGT